MADYSKKQGVAMGKKCSCVDCLFMEYFDESFFALYGHSSTILCKGYIDDIVGAAS